MGKYLPVITTAECGSLTRAGLILGYTQPSLGYIISNIEKELGVKLFHRDQRGVRLTDIGSHVIDLMREIEANEQRLQEAVRVKQAGLIRVGIFPSVAAQWLPSILLEFRKEFPDTIVKLEHQRYFLDGELGVKEHSLECAFFTGTCPRGMEAFPLYIDPYYLVAPEESRFAGQEAVSIYDVIGTSFIPTNESFDIGSAIRELYEQLSKTSPIEMEPQENQMAIAMVEAGLGVTVLPGLCLGGLVSNRKVTVIPLKERLTRTISLLCPGKNERTDLTSAFLRIVQKQVTVWSDRQAEE